MFQSKMPIQYWGESVLVAAYIINRLPIRLLKMQSPYERIYHRASTYDHIKSFGSLCYASTLQHGRDKFSTRAVACAFLGYPMGKKAYKLLNLEIKQVFFSRDVTFHENVFPFHNTQKPTYS